MPVSTNNGLVNGPVHNLLMQFFTVGNSKIEVFETCFYDIVTTLGGGGGSPRGLVPNLLMQFFTLGS